MTAVAIASRPAPTYRGYVPRKALSPEHHPGDLIVDAWNVSAERVAPSRARQVFCRDIRRGFIGYEPPSDWGALYGNGARQAVTVRYGERTELDDDLTNELSRPAPRFERTPIGTTETAVSDADDFERWLNSLFDPDDGLASYPSVVGELVEYGEVAGLLIPSAASLMALPMWDKNGVPDPRIDKAGQGRRASRRSWQEVREHYLATTSPFECRLVNALDCAPRLTRGQGGRYEPSGLIVRTLFDEDDLIQRGYLWPSMGDREKIPRGYDSRNTYGAEGQVYLYEAYLLEAVRMPDGKVQLQPYVVYCVGGQNTGWRLTDRDDETTAMIHFGRQYGARSRLWTYEWGVTSRDDPAYMGRPAHYAVFNQLLNAESLMSDMLAHTKANAFMGKYLKVDSELLRTDPKAYLDAQQRFRTVREAKSGELRMIPGDIVTAPRADMGGDVRYIHEGILGNMRATTAQPSGPSASGHAQTVSTELNRAQKGAISEGARRVWQFFGQTAAMLAEVWLYEKAKIELPAYVTTEEPATLEQAEREGQTALPFNPRWTRGNWKISAKFPDGGNPVEIDLERSLAKDGFSTFELVRKKAGDPSPRTTWVKMQAERYMASPEYQAYLSQELAARRGKAFEQKIAALKAQNKITDSGTPISAIERGLGGAASTGAAGGTGQPGPAGSGNQQAIATQQRAGVTGGAMEAAARNLDARAAMGIQNPGVV